MANENVGCAQQQTINTNGTSTMSVYPVPVPMYYGMPYGGQPVVEEIIEEYVEEEKPAKAAPAHKPVKVVKAAPAPVEEVSEENLPSNGWAVAGMVLAFLMPILGIVFASFGIYKAKEYKGVGKVLSIVALIIAIILTLWIFVAFFNNAPVWFNYLSRVFPALGRMFA